MHQGTSSTTGTDMIARARVYLGEESSVSIRWDDTDLLQFLNDGMVDIAARSQGYQGSESITLVANTIEYTPSAKYVEVAAVVINPAEGSKYGLKSGNIRSVGAYDYDRLTPTHWYEFAGKIGIYPAYTSVTTETATAYLIKTPAAIAAGGTVATPEIFDTALVYYIVWQGFLEDKRAGEASTYMQLYFSELDRFRQDFVGADSDTTDPIR